MFELNTLDIDDLERLRDAVNRRILEMRQTRGLALPELLRLLDEVKATLGDQGKEWHSLERWQYVDGEIRFWLNPKDHDRYNTGWFSIDDLIAWARDVGQIMMYQEDDDQENDTLVAGSAEDGITWFASGEGRNLAADDALHFRIQRFEL